MILMEMVHDARIVRIGGKHLPKTIRPWMGDSIGHWEGDTLVVDTTNFPPQQNFRGSSENLHVVERFRRADANDHQLPVHGRRTRRRLRRRLRARFRFGRWTS